MRHTATLFLEKSAWSEMFLTRTENEEKWQDKTQASGDP